MQIGKQNNFSNGTSTDPASKTLHQSARVGRRRVCMQPLRQNHVLKFSQNHSIPIPNRRQRRMHRHRKSSIRWVPRKCYRIRWWNRSFAKRPRTHSMSYQRCRKQPYQETRLSSYNSCTRPTGNRHRPTNPRDGNYPTKPRRGLQAKNAVAVCTKTSKDCAKLETLSSKTEFLVEAYDKYISLYPKICFQDQRKAVRFQQVCQRPNTRQPNSAREAYCIANPPHW